MFKGKDGFPPGFLEYYLAGSFTDTVKWWVCQNMETEPEQVASCYLKLVEYGISIFGN
ncbi:MAG: hypothetical protein SPF84_05760 [Lachnospiraceae bacterium]|nr:hypothetical protein [Lachnospiraceae bacterium]